MFLIDSIKALWCSYRAFQLEASMTFCKRSKIDYLKERVKLKFETNKAKAARLAKEEEERKQRLKESKERLALLLLAKCNGDEDAMNSACDVIKQLGLVEDYH